MRDGIRTILHGDHFTRPERRAHLWVMESIGLSAGLAILGIMLRPADPLFNSFSPSPFLLLPIIMGAQYGVAAGMTGAVTGIMARCAVAIWSGMIALPAAAFTPGALAEIAQSLVASPALERNLLIALFVGGVLIGELREAIQLELTRQREINTTLGTQIETLSRKHLLLKETKSSLERRLAQIADSQSTIYDEAVDLYQLDQRGIALGILRMLNRYAHVEEAAFYRLEQGTLRLAAQFGTNDYRPPEVAPNDMTIVRAALTSLETVTVRDLAAEQPVQATARGAIVAAPLVVHAARDMTAGGVEPQVIGVVVVDAIPFIRLNVDAVRLISLITDWGAQVIVEQDAHHELELQGLVDPILQVYRAPYMKEKLRNEFRRARQFRLDLNLLVVAPVTDQIDAVHREGLGLLTVAAARESCRPGEVVGICDQDEPHAVMILPLAAHEAAERRVQLIRSFWAGKVREELGGEELPPLQAMLVSNRDEPDGDASWERVERWVARHA